MIERIPADPVAMTVFGTVVFFALIGATFVLYVIAGWLFRLTAWMTRK